MGEEIKKATPATVKPAPQSNDVSIEIPDGHVLIQPVKDGKEAGEPFTVTERTAQKIYSDTTMYSIKKKA